MPLHELDELPTDSQSEPRSLDLATGGNTAQQLEFKLDFGVGFVHPSIVAFVLSAQSGNLSPTLSIKVNGSEPRSLKLPDGAFVTGLQPVIGPHQLHHGVNTIEFSIAGGTGTLEVLDGAGDTAAADLGLAGTLSAGETRFGAPVNFVTAATLLSSLNDGAGVRQSGGVDFTITATDGSTYGVDVGAAKTVGDAIAAINAATGGAVTVNMVGTNGPVSERTPIHQLTLTNGGALVNNFCLDLDKQILQETYCQEGSTTSPELVYLLTTYPPSLTDRIAQAARQAAVWHFTNNVNLQSPDSSTGTASRSNRARSSARRNRARSGTRTSPRRTGFPDPPTADLP